MMKNSKYLILAAMGLMCVPALAQETYQDTKIATDQLTGTARYVGMGGAMEALGADISTISSNPAGVGLIRRSQVSLSAGVIAQGDAKDYTTYQGNTIGFDAKKSHPTFDQVGIVWSPSLKGNSYLNLAFNYHKSSDFGQILNAANSLSNASQNKITAAKYSAFGDDDMRWNAVDAGYAGQEMFNYSENGATYLNSDLYLFGQYQHGYIGTYDFNISGGVNNRVWWGVTIGLHDVNYRSQSLYSENLEGGTVVNSYETLKIDGTGFDVKAGVIFRPVEESPFRIGAYVNSPVFYDLTMYGTNDMNYDERYWLQTADCNYDFRLNTPWKAGASIGHTVGTNFAFGATYEYAWYNHMDNRIKDGGYYDSWYGDYYETSSSDQDMNDNTRYSLKGVSTLKVGMEFKPVDMLAIRLGYNYVSPMFKEKGYRDQSISSPGTAYATSTDYTNWKATNRFTAGVGFNYDRISIDVAYQYSAQNGDFYPFMSYKDNSDSQYDCIPTSSEVSFKRHQLLMTVGYKF